MYTATAFAATSPCFITRRPGRAVKRNLLTNPRPQMTLHWSHNHDMFAKAADILNAALTRVCLSRSYEKPSGWTDTGGDLAGRLSRSMTRSPTGAVQSVLCTGSAIGPHSGIPRPEYSMSYSWTNCAAISEGIEYTHIRNVVTILGGKA